MDWTRTTTGLDTGVAFGSAAGAPIHEERTVEFTPNSEVRDHALNTARLALTIDREDVALTPAASGARPAERAAIPRHATVHVLDAGGWRFDPTHCAPLTGPSDIGERDRRVGFAETCELVMRGGTEDIASVRITIAGNGMHGVAASFGAATLR